MKKSKSIYLQADREAAENLKNLSTTLKLLRAEVEKKGEMATLPLNKICPVLQEVIKRKGVRKDVLNLSKNLRDHLLSKNPVSSETARLVRTLLEKVELDLNYKAGRYIKKKKDDTGMTELYRHLTLRLGRERLHKLGNKRLHLTDMSMDKKTDIKLMRRFVEKRAAQEVHKSKKKDVENSNFYRQRVRRVKSFSLYSTAFADYTGARSYGTHWKVVYVPGKGYKRLKAKRSFASYEEAWAACERYMEQHPEDEYPVSPYLCEECGHWHFGHDKYLAPFTKVWVS